MSSFRVFLLHVCVVCSFIGIISNVLDWYNPYMNFSGHILFVHFILYVSVLTLACIRRRRF